MTSLGDPQRRCSLLWIKCGREVDADGGVRVLSRSLSFVRTVLIDRRSDLPYAKIPRVRTAHHKPCLGCPVRSSVGCTHVFTRKLSANYPFVIRRSHRQTRRPCASEVGL